MKENKRATNLKILALIIVSVLVCGCACYSISYLYYQTNLVTCIDFLSGQVPYKATFLFLDRVVKDTVADDYDWLNEVGDPEAVEALQELQPKLSRSYKIVLSDDLAGLYEYKLEFEDGTLVYLTLWGEWPTCPDFTVTEEEISEYIQLASVREVDR